MERSKSGPRLLLVCWVHLVVLWSFAFAKPLFDILADSPEFFVARENSASDIVVLALGVTLVPPTLLILVESLFLKLARVRELLHLSFVGLLTAAIALQALKDLVGGAAAVLIPLALAVGGAGALAYARAPAVRAVLSVLSPVPLLFVLLFLVFSPVSELVFPESTGASEARAATGKPVPIVMVVFDELSGASLMDSSRHIDATRYPSFARLARDATWYRNATSVADFTSEAVPAVLSARRPEKGQLPIRSDHPNSIFTFLGSRYAFNVEEPVTSLCPSSLCGEEQRPPADERLRELASDLSIVSLRRLLPDDLAEHLPAVDQTFSGFAGDAGTKGTSGAAQYLQHRPQAFASFLRRIGSHSDRPTLDLIHTELPHVPWDYLPSGQEYVTSTESLPGVTAGYWSKDVRFVRQGQQRYLLQLAYVDRLLGHLLDRLRASGAYKRSLVVVTADHGVAFRPGLSRRAISSQTFEEIASVPLLIKAPGQRAGQIDDSPARNIDVLPTIADLRGTRISWPNDGHSLRRRAEPGQDSLSVFAKYGPSLGLAFSDFTRRRDALVRRWTGIYGQDDRGLGVFAPGEGSGLVGRAVAGLPADPPLRARAQLDDAHTYAHLPAHPSVLPVLLGGAITGIGPSRRIAVAVNGRVAGSAETYATPEETRFEAIIDPSTLKAGANKIALFELTGVAPGWRLAPIGQVNEKYRLVGESGDEEVVSSSGRRFRVVDGAVQGFVETLETGGPALRVLGWAASKQLGPATKVIAFVAGRSVAASSPSTPRTDVAKNLGPAALVSGFALATGLDHPLEARTVRVFGLAGGRASELHRLGER